MKKRHECLGVSSNKKFYLRIKGFVVFSIAICSGAVIAETRFEELQTLSKRYVGSSAFRDCETLIQEKAFDRLKDPLAILIDGSNFAEIGLVLNKILTIENKPEGLLENEIQSIFQAAKASDDVKERLKIALFFDANKRYDFARKLYEKGGHPKCQFELGKYYMLGYGVPRNSRKAIEYLSQIPDFGDASFLISELYYRGEGIEKDYNKSLVHLEKYYAKAPENRRKSMAFLLGQRYYLGRGCKKDYEIALTYFQEASESTDEISSQLAPKADLYIGRIYWATKERGDSYKKKALEAYERAAERGDVTSQRLLGSAYLRQGILSGLVEKDPVLAIYWYKRAAESGGFVDNKRLGDYYFHGTYVERSLGNAIKHYKAAAIEGDLTSQENMGEIAFKEKDYTNAYIWCNVASARGSERAKRRLKQIRKKLDENQIDHAEQMSVRLIREYPKSMIGGAIEYGGWR